MKFEHYIYVYLDPLKPGNYQHGKFNFDYEPFYIGLGKNNRIDVHIQKWRTNNSNTTKNRKIRKILKENLEPIRYKLYEDITLNTAKRLEIYLIKLIGRRDLGLGTLTNLTDGGDGSNNVIITEEQREQKRIKMIQQWKDGVYDNRDLSGEKNPFYNKTHTDETKDKIRNKIGDSRKGELNANFGNSWTEEQRKKASIINKENHKHLCGDNNPAKRKEVREKISESKMGLKNPNANLWKLISPDNEEIIIEGGIKRTLKEYGLTYQKMKWKIEDKIFYSKNGWKMYKIFG